MPGPIALLSTDLARVHVYAPGSSAPEVFPAPTEPPGNARDYRRRATEAAQWLATRPATRKRYAALVIDIDECLCRWVKGASAAPPVLTAALRQQNHEWGDPGHIALVEPVVDGRAARSAPGVPFAGLFQKARPARPGDDAASWDETTDAPPSAPSVPARGCVAIALPDALPRLVLDALDKQGVKVNATISLWHALAQLTGHTHDENRSGDAPEPEAQAVLAIEPGRRVVWSWGRGGRLLTGGSLPLEHDHAGQDAHAPAHAERAVRRLMLDWLSWAAQLGFVPSNIRILGPAKHPVAIALAAALHANEPSLRIGTEDHADGIAAAIRALATLPRSPQAGDPRQALARLSSRPNRATRQRYFTATAALLLIATAIAGLGYRFSQQARAWSSSVAQVNAETLQTAGALVPAARTPGSGMSPAVAEAELNTQLAELRARRPARSLREPNDLAAALDRSLGILERFEDSITIQHIKFSDLTENVGSKSNTISLTVPDLRTSLEIFEAFQKEDPIITWERSTARGRPENELLLEGSWRL